MRVTGNENIKTLIECSATDAEVDRIINDNLTFNNISEKIDFLCETFGIQLLSPQRDTQSYYAVVHSIICP